MSAHLWMSTLENKPMVACVCSVFSINGQNSATCRGPWFWFQRFGILGFLIIIKWEIIDVTVLVVRLIGWILDFAIIPVSWALVSYCLVFKEFGYVSWWLPFWWLVYYLALVFFLSVDYLDYVQLCLIPWLSHPQSPVSFIVGYILVPFSWLLLSA